MSEITITITVPMQGALVEADRLICKRALEQHPTLTEAAKALGITRHAMKRRCVKYGLQVAPGTDERSPP
jgi:hypothetical protein